MSEKITLFHKRNNEIIEDSDEAKRVLELIQEKEPIAQFTSEHNSYGYFHNSVYSVTGGLVVVSEWKPSYGYSWEERIISFIKIPQ